jgi:hypothetical protein
MLYEMEQGPNEKKIMRLCRESGQPIPKSILNAPTLFAGNEYYYSIWWELQSDRPVGFAPGMIPSSAVRSWLKDNDIPIGSEDAEDVLYIISQMDVAWLRWSQKKSAKDAEIRKKGK